MEDVKEQHWAYHIGKGSTSVSILVLMEDVKEPEKDEQLASKQQRFNPCFNGRCKRTRKPVININLIAWVSILVLMEDVKEHNEGNYGNSVFKQVSILVLMEDVKELIRGNLEIIENYKFQSLF